MTHGIQFPGQFPGPPALGAHSLSYWITKEVPRAVLFYLPAYHCIQSSLSVSPSISNHFLLRGLPLPSRQSFCFKAPFTSSFLKFTGIIINRLLPLLLHMVNSMMKRDFSKFLEYQIPFNLDKYGVVDTQQVLWIFLFAEWMNGWINWTELNWNYNLLHCKLKLWRVRIHMGSTKSLCSRS